MTSFFQVINATFSFISADIFNDITRPIAEIIEFSKLPHSGQERFVSTQYSSDNVPYPFSRSWSPPQISSSLQCQQFIVSPFLSVKSIALVTKYTLIFFFWFFAEFWVKMPTTFFATPVVRLVNNVFWYIPHAYALLQTLTPFDPFSITDLAVSIMPWVFFK